VSESTFNLETSEAFYTATGLQFECKRCSACCRFQPGFVFLSRSDLIRLLPAADMTWDEFKTRCLRSVKVGNFIRLSLREKENHDCIFWENGGCTVYKARPLQCRSFPFWSHLLESEETWREYKENCPGIDCGTVHSPREITGWLQARLYDRLVELEDDNLESMREEQILCRTDGTE
jgi:Fe-S-cluster containining protein